MWKCLSNACIDAEYIIDHYFLRNKHRRYCRFIRPVSNSDTEDRDVKK